LKIYLEDSVVGRDVEKVGQKERRKIRKIEKL
jgi:hypothetical protein